MWCHAAIALLYEVKIVIQTMCIVICACASFSEISRNQIFTIFPPSYIIPRKIDQSWSWGYFLVAIANVYASICSIRENRGGIIQTVVNIMQLYTTVLAHYTNEWCILWHLHNSFLSIMWHIINLQKRGHPLSVAETAHEKWGGRENVLAIATIEK